MSFYDARTGALYTFDDNEGKILKHPVAYADLDKKPGETPFTPDIEFQEKFDVAMDAALAELKGTLDYVFVIDKGRISGFDGKGFLNGDLTYFFVREDKEGFADYRLEFRASMMVPYFMQDRRNGIKNQIVKEFRQMDKKRD
jgi:hypothetical protein